MTAGAVELLDRATLRPVGVLREASNVTVLVDLLDGEEPTGEQAVYKPVRGTRPLHDFDASTLAARERAAYLVSEAGGWHLVPATVLRDGPLGPGSVQRWVPQVEPEGADADGDDALPDVDIVPIDGLRVEHRSVVQVEDQDGRPLVVVHRDAPELAAMAVLDAVLGNADRKAAHLGRDERGRLWGFDHGLCLHVEDKLRTVLWGWAGEPLPEAESQRLDRLLGKPTAALRVEGIRAAEWAALRVRARAVLDAGTFPEPPPGRYPLPWPLW